MLTLDSITLVMYVDSVIILVILTKVTRYTDNLISYETSEQCIRNVIDEPIIQGVTKVMSGARNASLHDSFSCLDN